MHDLFTPRDCLWNKNCNCMESMSKRFNLEKQMLWNLKPFLSCHPNGISHASESPLYFESTSYGTLRLSQLCMSYLQILVVSPVSFSHFCGFRGTKYKMSWWVRTHTHTQSGTVWTNTKRDTHFLIYLAKGAEGRQQSGAVRACLITTFLTEAHDHQLYSPCKVTSFCNQ